MPSLAILPNQASQYQLKTILEKRKYKKIKVRKEEVVATQGRGHTGKGGERGEESCLELRKWEKAIRQGWIKKREKPCKQNYICQANSSMFQAHLQREPFFAYLRIIPYIFNSFFILENIRRYLHPQTYNSQAFILGRKVSSSKYEYRKSPNKFPMDDLSQKYKYTYTLFLSNILFYQIFFVHILYAVFQCFHCS